MLHEYSPIPSSHWKRKQDVSPKRRNKHYHPPCCNNLKDHNCNKNWEHENVIILKWPLPDTKCVAVLGLRFLSGECLLGRESVLFSGCRHFGGTLCFQQGRQCTYKRNIQARSPNHCCRGKNQDVLHILNVCVCSLSYPACKAHAPYYIVWLYHIFPHYLINVTLFGTIMENKMCVLIFCTNFVWNISHSKKNSARYCHKCA